jgi:hypothetical protein
MSPAERRIGTHLSRREPPDIIIFTLVGELGEQDALGVLTELRGLASEISATVAAVADVSRLTRILPEARAMLTVRDQKRVTRMVALVGAAFSHRVVVSLLIKASALIRKESLIPLAFFDSESEARAWIEKQRRLS